MLQLIKCDTETDAVVLTKTEIGMPENGSFYVVGETVSYSIEAKNVSDHTVYDLEISDPIKGSNEDAVIDLGITLAPQQSVSYVYSRTVTEEEYESVTEAAADFGFENGWIQDYAAADPKLALLGENMSEGHGAVGR